MTKPGRAIDSVVARLARIGQARSFSTARFRRALATIHDLPERQLLRQLLAEWTGVGLGDDEAVEVFAQAERVHGALRACLGEPVSLLTALLHEMHTRRGLLAGPRLVPERDLHALRVNAITDPLTGLYNRRFMLEHLERELSRAERSGGVVSVLLMDLRSFKAINDRLGHPVGDSVLVRTARGIRDSLRVVDAGCRFGGDEFVAVLPNTDLVNGLSVAERIRQRVAGIRLPIEGGRRVGLYYGIATYPSDGRTPGFLMKTGDVRLYASKGEEAKRRYPRFTVHGVVLNVHGRRRREVSADVKDIGFGGLSFTHSDDRLPSEVHGEVLQRFSPEAHPVTIRPVSVVPLRNGRFRFGCAYVH